MSIAVAANATQIQLPQMIAGIARDLAVAVAVQSADQPRFAAREPGYRIGPGISWSKAGSWPACGRPRPPSAWHSTWPELRRPAHTAPSLRTSLSASISSWKSPSALSPAVNDTFTAMTCVDWLSDCLCKITSVWAPIQVHRDRSGVIRVISDQVSYERLVQRAFEKVRQASRGMPAVMTGAALIAVAANRFTLMRVDGRADATADVTF